MMEIRNSVISDALMLALEKQARGLTYTNPKTIYYCVDADYRNVLVGVIGDGGNGVYEWFIWGPTMASALPFHTDEDSATLRLSDCGYGCPGVALCCGLVEARARKGNGDHDLYLAWMRESANAPRANAKTSTDRDRLEERQLKGGKA